MSQAFGAGNSTPPAHMADQQDHRAPAQNWPNGNWLVEPHWLAEHLNAPDLIVLDASWYLPAQMRDPHAEYNTEHIPGALFFDIDEISDQDSPLPHMLPSPIKFSSRMRKMGIGDGMRIVVYDGEGIFSAPRVWWMFRAMGVEDVAVLNGGLPKWKAENLPLEDMPPPKRSERHFTARFNRDFVRDIDDIKANLASKHAQVLDARGASRFRGEEAEPRPGLKSGHIPGSCNLPYKNLLQADGTLHLPDQLRAAFKEAGVNIEQPIITTCGSGVTASILSFALSLMGHKHCPVYDGSWSEWGAGDNPIE